MAGFPKTVLLPAASSCVVLNPKDKSLVWASSPFARHYLGIRCFFLFLRLLRCFSSPGSLRMTMDSSYGDRSSFCRVSPFGYLRINGYLLLPAAFRSLSRPSSAPGAKASALRPCNLDLKLRWECSTEHLRRRKLACRRRCVPWRRRFYETPITSVKCEAFLRVTHLNGILDNSLWFSLI